MLGTDEFRFVLVVIFCDFVLADGDVRTDFAADDALGEQAGADIVLEIFPVGALRGDGFFEVFHGIDFILDANLIELFDDFGLDIDAHILAALDEQRLVNQIAESVFLAVFDVGLELLGSAFALAFLLGVLFGGSTRFVELGAGDDLVVDAGDDFLDGLGVGAFDERLLGIYGGGTRSGSGAAITKTTASRAHAAPTAIGIV